MADSEVAKITASLELDTGDTESQLDDVKDKFEELKDKADECTDLAISVDAGDAIGTLDEVQSQLSELSGNEAMINITADDAISNIQDAEGALSDLQSQVSDVSNVEITANSSEFVGACDQASGSVGNLSGELNLMQDLIGNAFEAAEVVAFALAVNAAAEASKELADEWGQMESASTAGGLKAGGNVASMDTYTKEIQDLSMDMARQTGQSPEELAGLISTLLGYGMKTENLNAEALKPFTELGVLPGVGLQNAGELISLSSKAFNTSTQQAADMISATLESSNISAGNLAGALSKGGLAAETAGMDLPSLLSVYRQENVMRGFDPSQVNMALMSASSKLSQPLDVDVNKKGEETYKGLAKELHDEGIGFDTVNNKSDSFMQKLVNLDKAGADFVTIFGRRQGQILKDLADNADGVNGFSEALRNGKGEAEAYADAVQDNYVQAMNRAGYAATELKDKIGGDLAPTFVNMANWFATTGYEAANSFIKGLETGDFSPFLQKIKEIGTQLESEVGNWFNNIDYAKFGDQLANGLEGAWVTAESTLNSVIGEKWTPEQMLGSLNSFGKSFMDAVGPSLLVGFTGALEGAAPAIATLETSFEYLQSIGSHAFKDIGNSVQDLADTIYDSLLGAISAALSGLSGLVGAASSLSSSLFGNNNGTSGPLRSDVDLGNGYKVGPGDSEGTYVVKKDGKVAERGDTYSDLISKYGSNNSTMNFGAFGASAKDYSLSSGVGKGKESGLIDKIIVNGEGQSGADILSGKVTPIYDENARVVGDQSQKVQQSTGVINSFKDSIDAAKKLVDDQITSHKQGETARKANESKEDTFDWNEHYTKNLAGVEAAIHTNDTSVNLLRDGYFMCGKDAETLTGKVTDLGNASQKATSQIAEAANQATESAKSTTVGYNQLKTIMDECTDCALSDFAKWQESQSDMFQGAYIGPSSGYDAWLKSQPQSPLGHPGVDELGINYNEQSTKKTIDLDDASALATNSALNQELQTPKQKPVNLDDASALAESAALDTELSQTVYKTVVVNTVGGGAGGGGEASSGQNPNGAGWLPESALFDTMPAYAEGGHVEAPHIALVGENGPETIIPDAKLNGMGNRSISIGDFIVQGNINGVDDLEARFAAHADSVCHRVLMGSKGL
jgi:hypothetical protein